MNHNLSRTFFVAVAAIALFSASPSHADGRFSVAVGTKDQLVIFGPDGAKVGEFNAPTIGQNVKVGGASFEVSFGRDANDLWTAIIAPDPSQPSDLSFTVLDNKIDADKNSAVTLTFSKDLRKVTVDPGYLGIVKVNDSRISREMIAGSQLPTVTPPSMAPSAPAKTPGSNDTMASAPAVAMSSDNASATTTTTPPPAPEPQLLNPKTTYWSEPVTPPNPKNLPAIGPDEIKLLEVRGNVTVLMPNSSQPVTATNGMTIPSGATVKTGDDGTAAAFLSGVNSARFLPESEGTVNQTVANSKRSTLIDLKTGVVFANVGRRAGETQDFKVKTPGGVAAAKGTAFLAKYVNGHLFIATYNGNVDVTDNSGKLIGTSSPTSPGNPGIFNPDLVDEFANDAILADILRTVELYNTKVDELLAKDPSTLTPEEKNWLERAPKIAENVVDLMNDALKRRSGTGETPEGPGGGIGPGSGGFGEGFGSPNFNPNAVIENTTPA